MSKKSITLIIFILFVSFGIISLYTTFAFNEEDTKMDESQANYNLIYPLNDLRKQEVVIPSGEEKNVDIAITNTYNTTLRYGLCYKLVSPDTKPDELVVSTASESDNPSESTIKTGENKIITIKVVNNSEYNVDMLIGTLVGFENGDIKDLLTGEEILIN